MIHFTKRGWEDYSYWIEADKKKLARINELINGNYSPGSLLEN